MCIEFLDDPSDPHHRPHHVYRIILGPEKFQCLAKENEHCENHAYEILGSTPLSQFIPSFYGFCYDDMEEYIMIQDFNAGFSSPCIADFKIGTRSWDLNQSFNVKRKLKAKNRKSTSKNYGIRLVSEILRKNNEETSFTTKSDNLLLDAYQLQMRIHRFIQETHREYIVDKLVQLKHALIETRVMYPNMRLYSSSILIVYDGDNLEMNPRISLIDFAHLQIDISEHGANVRNKNFDDGIEKGIDSFIELIVDKEKFLPKNTKNWFSMRKNPCMVLLQ